MSVRRPQSQPREIFYVPHFCPGKPYSDADDLHAVFAFTHNLSARAKLVRDLVNAGFDVAGFGASTKALEESYFAQVGKR